MGRWKWWLGGFALVLITCAGLGTIAVRHVITQHSRPHGHGNITFDVSADGSKIVFVAEGQGGRDLFLYDLHHKNVARLTNSPDYEVCPTFSPDGRQIAFTRGTPGVRADQLCIMDLETRHVEQLTDADENISSPTFTHDGRSVIFSLETQYRWGGLASSWNERGALVMMDLKSRERKVLVREGLCATDAVALPDGKRLAWQDARGLCIASLEKTEYPEILGPQLAGIAISQDGKQLATLVRQSADFHVVISPIEGGPKRKVPGTGRAKKVRFLPDGDLLVLTEHWRKGPTGSPTRSLWRLNLAGSGRQLISEAGFSDPSGGIQ